MTVEAKVLGAWDAGGGRARAVCRLDDDRIGLFEGRIDRGEPGQAMFEPQDLAAMRRYAEMVIGGNAVAIAHPKGMLVLATALVAVLETLMEEVTS